MSVITATWIRVVPSGIVVTSIAVLSVDSLSAIDAADAEAGGAIAAAAKMDAKTLILISLSTVRR